MNNKKNNELIWEAYLRESPESIAFDEVLDQAYTNIKTISNYLEILVKQYTHDQNKNKDTNHLQRQIQKIEAHLRQISAPVKEFPPVDEFNPENSHL